MPGKMSRRFCGQLALLALPIVLLACAPGAPPPGPVDIVRKIFNPSYDYTQSPSTWGDDDSRHARSYPGQNSSSPCHERDLTCTHEGTTICCSHDDRCCAGRTGPFCCRSDSPGYDDDRSGRYDGE
jgi:hypothetical protein